MTAALIEEIARNYADRFTDDSCDGSYGSAVKSFTAALTEYAERSQQPVAWIRAIRGSSGPEMPDEYDEHITTVNPHSDLYTPLYAARTPESQTNAAAQSSTEKLRTGGHDWVPPNDIIRWDHCAICGIIRSRKEDNNPCKGAAKIALREYYTEGQGEIASAAPAQDDAELIKRLRGERDRDGDRLCSSCEEYANPDFCDEAAARLESLSAECSELIEKCILIVQKNQYRMGYHKDSTEENKIGYFNMKMLNEMRALSAECARLGAEAKMAK